MKVWGIGSVVVLLFVLILSNTTQTQASYSEGIEIDCTEDPGYSKIIEIDGYNISYANDEEFHYLFIMAPYNFTGQIIRIWNDEFSYNITESIVDTSYIISRYGNNTLELAIKREIIGNVFGIEIEGNDKFILTLHPESRPTTYPTDEDDEDDDDKDSVDQVDFTIFEMGVFIWRWLWNTPGIYFWLVNIYLILFIRVWRVCTSPYCWVKGTNGKAKYMGRYASQFPSKDLEGFWELTFKRFGKLMKVYSRKSYSDLEQHCYLNLGIVRYFSDIIYRDTNIPSDIVIYEKERVKSFENDLKYAIYRIISFIIPSVPISRWVHSIVQYQNKPVRINGGVKKVDKKTGEITYYRVEKKDEKGKPIPIRIKKIPVLQHQLLYDKIRIMGEVVYKKKITDESGEHWEEPIREQKNIFEIEDLRKNEKVEILGEGDYRIDVVQEHDLEEAILKQNHRDNLKSIADLKYARLRRENIELDKKLNISREQLEDLNRHMRSKLMEISRDIFQKSTTDMNSLVNIISIALTGMSEHGDVYQASRDAFRYYYEIQKGRTQKSLEESKELKEMKKDIKTLKNQSIITLLPMNKEDEEQEDDLSIN